MTNGRSEEMISHGAKAKPRRLPVNLYFIFLRARSLLERTWLLFPSLLLSDLISRLSRAILASSFALLIRSLARASLDRALVTICSPCGGNWFTARATRAPNFGGGCRGRHGRSSRHLREPWRIMRSRPVSLLPRFRHH